MENTTKQISIDKLNKTNKRLNNYQQLPNNMNKKPKIHDQNNSKNKDDFKNNLKIDINIFPWKKNNNNFSSNRLDGNKIQAANINNDKKINNNNNYKKAADIIQQNYPESSVICLGSVINLGEEVSTKVRAQEKQEIEVQSEKKQVSDIIEVDSETDDGEEYLNNKNNNKNNKNNNIIHRYAGLNFKFGVDILPTDLDYLNDNSYTNQNIIEFYIEFIRKKFGNEKKVFIFNTFFMSSMLLYQNNYKQQYGNRLPSSKERYDNIKRQLQKINIFSFDFLIFPLFHDNHWSVLIVCYPKEVLQQGTCIVLHFDSLKKSGNHSDWRGYKSNINSILEFERHRYVQGGHQTKNKINYKILYKGLSVPQQENQSDCGLFMLTYIEYFLYSYPMGLTKQVLENLGAKKNSFSEQLQTMGCGFPNFLQQDWFKSCNGSRLRKFVKILMLQNMLEQATDEQKNLPSYLNAKQDLQKLELEQQLSEKYITPEEAYEKFRAEQTSEIKTNSLKSLSVEKFFEDDESSKLNKPIDLISSAPNQNQFEQNNQKYEILQKINKNNNNNKQIISEPSTIDLVGQAPKQEFINNNLQKFDKKQTINLEISVVDLVSKIPGNGPGCQNSFTDGEVCSSQVDHQKIAEAEIFWKNFILKKHGNLNWEQIQSVQFMNIIREKLREQYFFLSSSTYQILTRSGGGFQFYYGGQQMTIATISVFCDGDIKQKAEWFLKFIKYGK